MRCDVIVITALGLLLGCDPEPDVIDAAVDAGPLRCTRQGQCGPGTSCVRDRIAEVRFEPEEVGLCVPSTEAIGGDAPRWDFRPSGVPLADRLCTAQGLNPGSGATDRRRELLREAGVAVARLDFRWDRIERAPGVIDFDAHDAMLDAADAEGIEVVGILAYGNPWASAHTEDDPFFPPDDPADFAAWAGAMAAHYRGRVRRWEIWNEQNAGYRFWLPELHGEASAYAELLAMTASAIHGECADCLVLSGGLFFHEQLINGAIEFTHDMLEARPDVFDGVDALAFHPYPLYPPSAAPEADGAGQRSIGAMASDLRAVLEAHGVEELPLAATELGWPVHDDVDEARQARLLSRAMLLGAALDIDPLCWFNVADGPNHGMFPPEDDFGLYRYGSEDGALPIDPKPARDAMAWLSRIGDGAVFVGPADDPELHAPELGRFALDFERAEGRWRVLFSTTPFDAALGGEMREARDHLGNPVSPGTTWSIGGDPLFFVPPGI